MRVLVVGAGAVGQVYGWHLARGGAEVTFLVKPSHAGECRAGLTLYALNRRGRRRTEPVRFTGFGVLTELEDVARARFDQVYLTVSSTALRAPGWFAALAGTLGPATVVVLQPGLDDRAFVGRHLPDEQIVQGGITLVSYRAPLPGEARFAAPGVAYWFPPVAASPMSGSPDRLRAVLAALRAGGLPARRHPDVGAVAPFATALLTPLVAALEAAGWSLARFRRGDGPGRAARAGLEALEVVARRTGRRPPRPLPFVCRPFALRAALALAPRIMPLDVETYLRVHFTKVGDQTRDQLDSYVELGRAAGLPVDGLRALAA